MTATGVQQGGERSRGGYQDAGETQGMMSRARRDLLEETSLMTVWTSAEVNSPVLQGLVGDQEIGREPTQMRLDQGLAGTVIGDRPSGEQRLNQATGDQRTAGPQANAPPIIDHRQAGGQRPVMAAEARHSTGPQENALHRGGAREARGSPTSVSRIGWAWLSAAAVSCQLPAGGWRLHLVL